MNCENEIRELIKPYADYHKHPQSLERIRDLLALAPNGTGVLLEHREYQDNSSTENWTTRRYEGTFVDGKLTGSGWSSFESASGGRYEYFDGTYHW